MPEESMLDDVPVDWAGVLGCALCRAAGGVWEATRELEGPEGEAQG